MPRTYDDYDDLDDFDGFDDGEREPQGVPMAAVGAGVVALVAVVAAFAFGLGPFGGDDDQDTVASETVESAAPATSSDATSEDATTDDEVAQAAESDESASGSDEDSDDPDGAATNDEGDETTADGTALESGNPDQVPAATTVGGEAASEPVAGEPSYPVLPDGSPVPVLVIFDGDVITLSGVVPNEASAMRLQTLALAFSKVPDAQVASFITIDPTVPINVGVRVIEMNSVRFPAGEPTVLPEHALELDRVVAMMNALPHVNTLVIGHADQRGDDAVNYQLSADRARLVSDYIASQGIDPSRLSARGAGESDLLTLNNDDAALALNRRTEFVISGLLVDPPADGEPAADPPATDPPAADQPAGDAPDDT